MPATTATDIRYARGLGAWQPTYAQSQELPPLHVTDEQMVALRAALRAANTATK
ncbi:hypothetical protein [Williamsia sp.]|uniref:hypothetical protein n=1 Tax=Williamsia sp. TaxID=1872085 RepID=UPI002F92B2EB